MCLNLYKTDNKDLLSTLIKDDKIDANMINREANTALHIAAKTNKDECIELLVSNGAGFVVRNKEGDSPLALAIKNKNTKFISNLLKEADKKGLADAVVQNYIHEGNFKTPSIDAKFPMKGIKQEQLDEINQAIEGLKKSGLQSPPTELEEKIKKEAGRKAAKKIIRGGGNSIIQG